MTTEKIYSVRCKQIGCEYEASALRRDFVRKALDTHLAEDHGIGRRNGSKTYLGCPFRGCKFEASGSEGYAALQVRGHMITEHGIDPKDPKIPAEARRGR